MRRFFTFTIVIIALVAGLYTQRVEVLDWYRSVSAPALPEAVSFEEVPGPQAGEQVEEGDEVGEIGAGEVGGVRDVGEEESMNEPEMNDDTTLSRSTESPISTFVQRSDSDVKSADESSSADEELVAELPSEINLAVPFTPQAPHGNWGEPYQEACEEASVYMVQAYYEGQSEGKIPADRADLDLLNIVAFEEELFGFYKDTTAEKTGIFAELKFGYTYRLIEEPTIEQIKTELVAGRPVIVPAAGRLLGNPFFTAPGPIYHMLVIRGYTQDDRFIVNDPGTSHGEAYLYDFDTIMNAMHDWNEGGEITEGGKVVLVLSP